MCLESCSIVRDKFHSLKHSTIYVQMGDWKAQFALIEKTILIAE